MLLWSAFVCWTERPLSPASTITRSTLASLPSFSMLHSRPSSEGAKVKLSGTRPSSFASSRPLAHRPENFVPLVPVSVTSNCGAVGAVVSVSVELAADVSVVSSRAGSVAGASTVFSSGSSVVSALPAVTPGPPPECPLAPLSDEQLLKMTVAVTSALAINIRLATSDNPPFERSEAPR